MKIRTEFDFVLPKGTTNEEGTQQKIRGVMRLVKIKDLLDIYHDMRIKTNPSYFYIILLSKAITKLSNVKMVTPKVIENLAPLNFSFLVDFFNEINHKVITSVPVECSNCKNKYLVEVKLSGEF